MSAADATRGPRDAAAGPRETMTRLVPLRPAPPGPGRLVGRAHRGAARAITRAGDRLLTVGDDGRLCVWAGDALEATVGVLDGPLHAVAHVAAPAAAAGARVAVPATGDAGAHAAAPAAAVAAPASARVVVAGEAGAAVVDLAGAPSVRHRLPPGFSQVAAWPDRTHVLLGGERLARLDPVSGDVAPLPAPLPAPTVDLVPLAGGRAAATDGRTLVLLNGDDGAVLARHDLAPLTSGRFYGARLRAHPDGRRVLAALTNEQMCLYIVTDHVLIDALTGAAEPLRDAGDDGWRTPWLLPDGARLWIGGDRSGLGGAPEAGWWQLAFAGLQVTDALALTEAPRVVYTTDAEGALRRWDLRATAAPAPIEAGMVAEGARADAVATWQPRTSTLRWWSLADGALLGESRVAGPAAGTLHHIPGGDRVALRGDAPSPGARGQLVVRARDGAEVLDALAPLGAAPSVAAVSEDGRTGAVIGLQYRLVMGPDGRALPVDHREWGPAVRLADGRTAVTGDAEGRVRGWDLETGARRFGFERAAWVQGLAATPDGDVVALFLGRGGPSTLARFDGRTGAVVAEVELPEGVRAAPPLRARPDGRIALGPDGALAWDPATGAFAEAPPWTAAVETDLELASYTALHVLDLVAARVSCTFEGDWRYARAVVLSPDGRRTLVQLLTAAECVSLDDGGRAPAHPSIAHLRDVRLTDDGAVVVRRDDAVRCLDPVTGETRWAVPHPAGPWTLLPDGRVLLGRTDGTVAVVRGAAPPDARARDAASDAAARGAAHDAPARGAAHDAAARGAAHDAPAHDVARLDFAAHAAPTRAVATSPDGAAFASGSADGEVAVWSLADGACVARWDGAEPVIALRWPRPDRLLVIDARDALTVLALDEDA